MSLVVDGTRPKSCRAFRVFGGHQSVVIPVVIGAGTFGTKP